MKLTSRCPMILMLSALCLIVTKHVLADLQLNVPSPIQLVADGKSKITIKVHLADNGKAVSGKQIAAAVTPAGDASILGVIPDTDANGDSSIVLQAGTKPENATLAISSGTPPAATNTVQIVLTQPVSLNPLITDIYPKSVDISVPIRYWNTKEAVLNEKQGFVITGSNLPADPNQIHVRIGKANAKIVEVDSTKIYAVLDNREAMMALLPGPQPVTVTFDGDKPVILNNAALNVANSPLTVTVASRVVDPMVTCLVFIAALLVGTILLYGISIVARTALQKNTDISRVLGDRTTRLKRGDWIPRWFGGMILDPQTNTYSLARAQFVWWVSLIIYGWIFLFIGRWLIDGTPSLITVSGFAYTFLISLTTLVAASATSIVRGNKGAGDVHPSPSDLVATGGVVALERAQQVAWNVVIGIAFVCITVAKYTQSASFPTIPNELLGLMGISAAGYIGGKAARQPGPNIGRVEWKPGAGADAAPSLLVYGDNLSNGNKKLLDGQPVPNTSVTDMGVTVQLTPVDPTQQTIVIAKDRVITVDFDPATPSLFARTLQVDLSGTPFALPASRINSAQDLWGSYKLTVSNADGQKAVFDGTLTPTPPVA